MIGIDTNVLIRYLTNDDAIQAQIAADLLNNYSGKKESIYISNIVLCEVIWVLESGYKYSRDNIVLVIKSLLQTPEFKYEYYDLLVIAIIEYEKANKADFADILISLTNKNAGCLATYSFDKTAIKLNYFQAIEV